MKMDCETTSFLLELGIAFLIACLLFFLNEHIRRKRHIHEAQHLLVVRLSALGDVAMTIPVIYSVAKRYPRLRISVLTRPFFCRLFINKPENVELLSVDYRKEYIGLRGTVTLLQWLSAQEFDAIADLHNVSRSWIIDAFFLLKGRKVAMVNKMRSKRRALLAHHAEAAQPNYIQRYATVFAQLGYPAEITFRSLFETGISHLPFQPEKGAIGIAPFARYPNKVYPLHLMRQVVETLTQEGRTVYLFGGKGEEAEILEEWQRTCQRCISLTDKYPIEQELAVISSLRLMVSMDSANQHLASLAGTTALTLWGSTTPACGFLGYRQHEANACCLNLSCQPCSIAGSNKCTQGTMECLSKITPESVVLKIKQIL